MERQKFTKFVAEMLYLYDPMESNCKVNNVLDWYSEEADAITPLVFDKRQHVSDAMFDVLTNFYGWDYVVTKRPKILECYKSIATKLYK